MAAPVTKSLQCCELARDSVVRPFTRLLETTRYEGENDGHRPT